VRSTGGESVELHLFDVEGAPDDRPQPRDDPHARDPHRRRLDVLRADPDVGPGQGRPRKKRHPDRADRDLLTERHRKPCLGCPANGAAQQRRPEQHGRRDGQDDDQEPDAGERPTRACHSQSDLRSTT
jgi:hypothetical protein